jgi:hypothetical protein
MQSLTPCLLLLLLQMANFVRAEELLEELRDKSFDAAKVSSDDHGPMICNEHLMLCILDVVGVIVLSSSCLTPGGGLRDLSPNMQGHVLLSC